MQDVHDLDPQLALGVDAVALGLPADASSTQTAKALAPETVRIGAPPDRESPGPRNAGAFWARDKTTIGRRGIRLDQVDVRGRTRGAVVRVAEGTRADRRRQKALHECSGRSALARIGPTQPEPGRYPPEKLGADAPRPR